MATKPVVEIKVRDSNGNTVTAATTNTNPSTGSSIRDVLKKFTSRKFIMSLVGVIVGILGIVGANDNVVAIVAFAALEILSILAYIIMEGHVDAKAVQSAVDAVNALLDMIAQMNNGESVTTPETKPSDDILNTLPEAEYHRWDILNTLPEAVAYSVAHPDSKVMITIETQNKTEQPLEAFEITKSPTSDT